MQNIGDSCYPKRNITLDYFKLILAILVVFIHTGISGLGYPGLMLGDGISRIAVPCFFIINGYYFANIIDNRKAVVKYIIRVCILYVTWTLVYLPFIHSSTMSFAMVGELFIDLVFGFYHLWYLVALIGAALLIYFTKKVNSNFMLVGVIVFYVLVSILQFIYGEELLTFKYRDPIFRGFLTVGLPFMFAGYFIRTKEKMSKLLFSTRLLQILLSIGLIMLFTEQYVIHKHFVFYPFFADRYISLIFLCPILFLYILRISKYKNTDGYISKLSSAVYFIHILIIFLFSLMNIFGSIQVSVPLIIFITFVFSAGIIELNKRLKIFL